MIWPMSCHDLVMQMCCRVLRCKCVAMILQCKWVVTLLRFCGWMGVLPGTMCIACEQEKERIV